jgi:hypothetical protein
MNAPASTAPDWTASFDPEKKGYIANKGFRDPGMLLESYINLEKLRGVPEERLLKLPEKLDDMESMKDIYAKLGRPAKADDYEITVPEKGGDAEFAKWAKEMFHAQGLSKTQAAKIVEGWNQYSENYQKSLEGKAQEKAVQEESQLKKKWGAAFEQNTNIAKRAAVEFKLTPDEIDAMESSFGFARVMEIFHNIGSKMGEASFHSSAQSGNGFGGQLTPDQARAKISHLKSDASFSQRYISGDQGALAEMERLMQMAYPSS